MMDVVDISHACFREALGPRATADRQVAIARLRPTFAANVERC